MVIVYLLISHLIFNYLRQGDGIPSAICRPQYKLEFQDQPMWFSSELLF